MKISKLISVLSEIKEEFESDLEVSISKYDYASNLINTKSLEKSDLYIAPEGLRIYYND